jgi:lysophospholipase L1-like esterase
MGLFLLLSSTVLCLFLGEGFLRLFPGLLPREIRQGLEANPHNMGVGHSYVGYLHTPGSTGVIKGRSFAATYHTDGHGFRNAWPWPEEADIVVVGDSFVFGYGVEDDEAWPAILAQALPQARLLNLGLIGASPEQYRRVYETFGMQMRPKVLLVGMLMANDFWDAEMFDRWLARGGQGNYMTWRNYDRYVFTLQEPIEGLKNLGRRYSYLYNLVQHAYKMFRSGTPYVLPFADGKQVQLWPSRLDETAAMAQPHRSQFHLVLESLTRLQALATGCGTHVLVIFQPGKEEVYLPFVEESTPDPGAPLRAALGSRGIDFLDLTPAFRQQAQAGQRLFFEIDGHPNRAGYRLIASEVLKHLKKNAATYNLPAMVAE